MYILSLADKFQVVNVHINLTPRQAIIYSEVISRIYSLALGQPKIKIISTYDQFLQLQEVANGRQVTILLSAFLGEEEQSYYCGRDLLDLMTKSLVICQTIIPRDYSKMIVEMEVGRCAILPEPIGLEHSNMSTLSCPKSSRINRLWTPNIFAVPVLGLEFLDSESSGVMDEIIGFFNGENQTHYCAMLRIIGQSIVQKEQDVSRTVVTKPWNLYTFICNSKSQDFLQVMYDRFGYGEPISELELIRLGFVAGLRHFEILACLCCHVLRRNDDFLEFVINPDFKSLQHQIDDYKRRIEAIETLNAIQSRFEEYQRLDRMAYQEDTELSFWDESSTFNPQKINDQVFSELERSYTKKIPSLIEQLQHYQSLLEMNVLLFG